ncbi:three component ABC system middle component [Undibacterium sp. Ji50W]|uniref:three component ABC system middle component n=1 Tax=Undibacterium sp. Ji50W TaxID=3413041 RepID=UPI003BF15511
MTSLVDALYVTKYNPFKYGEFVASFYSELTNVENNLLLAPLIVPLCSHHVFSGKLSNAKFGVKSKSTVWTIFSDRELLYDLQERLDDFKILTDQSLQYCLANDWLEIEIKMLNVIRLNPEEATFVKQKSAANLGTLFSNLSVIDIYALLGATPR